MTEAEPEIRPPRLPRVTFESGAPVVDAAAVAPLLGLDVAAFRNGLKSGEISTRLERGEGDDEGRMRLTFRSAGWRLRMTCDANGDILSVSRVQQGSGPSV